MNIEYEYHPGAFALFPVVGASWCYSDSIDIVLGWFFWSVTFEIDRVQK